MLSKKSKRRSVMRLMIVPISLCPPWSEQDLTAVFGNSEDVRQEYYYFGRKRSAVAALGRTSNASAAVVPPVVRQETLCYGLDYRTWEDSDDFNSCPMTNYWVWW